MDGRVVWWLHGYSVGCCCGPRLLRSCIRPGTCLGALRVDGAVGEMTLQSLVGRRVDRTWYVT